MWFAASQALLLAAMASTASAAWQVPRDRVALPLPPVPGAVFVKNAGQWDCQVLAAARAGGVLVLVTIDGVGLQFQSPRDADGSVRGQVLWLGLDGVASPLRAEFEGAQRGHVHLIRHAASSAETFESLVVRSTGGADAWRLRLDAARPGIKFDRCAGGARWKLAGNTAELVRHANGSVTVPLLAGSVVLRAAGTRLEDTLLANVPAAAPVRAGDLQPAIEGTPSFSFDWATFIDGASNDDIKDVAIDNLGNVYCTGETISSDFIITPGAFQAVPGGIDGYVMKLRIDPPELVFSTLIGGDGTDRGELISVGLDGAMLVAGQAGKGFPTTPGAYDTFPDGFGTFITRLAPDGASLQASTLFNSLNGGGVAPQDMAVEPDGSPVIVGSSSTDTLPVTPGALQPNEGSSFASDGFVAVLSPDLSALDTCTYLGGVDGDTVRAVSIARDGSLLLVGDTTSNDFPLTPGVYDAGIEFRDAFAARISADGLTLLASTLLGATREERGLGVAEGPFGEMVVVGRTLSSNFPTTPDALETSDKTFDGFAADGFLSILSADATTLDYSTYLNTFGWDEAARVRTDPSGVISVAGITSGPGLPTTPGALAEVPVGVGGIDIFDLFVLRFDPDLDRLLYSSYFGSTGGDSAPDGIDMDVGPYGELVVGTRCIGGFMVPGLEQGPFDPSPTLGTAGLLGVLTMLPDGVARYGYGTQGPDGPVALGVLSIPAVAEAGFGISTSNAPRHAIGLLALAADAATVPVLAAGIDLWLDPAQLMIIAPIASDARGWSQLRISVPPIPALVGTTVYAQSFWPHGTTAGSWRASNALQIVVQAALP